MVAAPKTRYTYAEYVELERQTDVRHEFLNGEVWAMAGGSIRHSGIKRNLVAALANALRGRACQPYDSVAKLRLETGLVTYPDASVVCGRIVPHPEDDQTITNPTVVCEVLSPSTESWDRGAKFMHLRRVGSMRHYVLISSDEARVEIYDRIEDGWHLRELGPGGTIALTAAGIELQVDDLYLDLPEL